LAEPRTDSLSHGDVYTGLQAVIAILAALNSRQKTGRGQYIDVAMAATLMAVNERAHVDLSDADLGAEPAILGATDCSFFTGPQGEFFTVATSIVGSRTFPSWLRAMRRIDLLEDPRFSSAAARRTNFGALHQIIQSWMLTFPDMAMLDAQLDEAKIAMGQIRSLRDLATSEWSDYWGAVQCVSDRNGGEYRLPGRPWRFSGEELTAAGTPAFQGEHNIEVFRELGVSETELKRLTESGVLIAHPRGASAEREATKPGQAA
jgi:crotonobetainyl-CoA:carnitine CoA-transferase CaiB-like acyl-CoA transferase